MLIRQREDIRPIEPARALAQPRIQAVEEIRARYDEEAVVVLEPVHFVEEVAAGLGGDDGFDVFEDEHAGGEGAGLREDVADVVGSWGGFDVEGWDWGGAGEEESVHQGFDGDGFAVAAGMLVS